MTLDAEAGTLILLAVLGVLAWKSEAPGDPAGDRFVAWSVLVIAGLGNLKAVVT